MTSATEINLIPQHSLPAEVQRRATFNKSLLLGIVLIAVFLGLFVLEFTRILSLTGKVDHAPPATRLKQAVSSAPDSR